MMQLNIENAFNNIFWVVMFRELCDVGGPLANIILSIINMGGMWRGSPLLNHPWAQSKVTL